MANSGGLPESVHHRQTGWVIELQNPESIVEVWKKEIEPDYSRVSRHVFNHTTQSHGLDQYAHILKELIL